MGVFECCRNAIVRGANKSPPKGNIQLIFGSEEGKPMLVKNNSLSKAIVAQVVEDVPKNWIFRGLNTQRLHKKIKKCNEKRST
jgi:hypothetical protein